MPNLQDIKTKFGIIGDNPMLNEAIERAAQVANVNFSVLVLGESGAGKEFFPKIIHDKSKRRLKKYIAVNCGAIPEGTIDSELFGHVKGAFTGAIADHKGYFEEANEGTIFLDEVAELPLSTQARLLRVLESGEFLRVGSNTVQKTDVRIIAATNRNLVQLIKEGRFRQDLYYRLSTIIIEVPPLRERPDDIDKLVRKFVSEYQSEYKADRPIFDEQAKEALRVYRWPGNVRELKNLISRICVLEEGKTITKEIVNNYLHFDSDKSYMPVLADAGADNAGWQREREYLYQMILQLGKQVKDMQERIDRYESVFTGDRMHISADTNELRRETSLLPRMSVNEKLNDNRNNQLQPSDDAFYIEDGVVVNERNNDDTLTLRDMERNKITEALHRNHGRRKATAVELGISERTLYRKIKEYELK